METLIVICLMIVIALLIHDKIDYKKKQEHQLIAIECN